MSGDNKDRELDEYLQGDSGLSRLYREGVREEPPGYLDDAILAAARREVRSRPRIAYTPFSSDWHVPVSIAAVLVLCVTLVVTIQETGDDSYQPLTAAYEPERNRDTAAAGDMGMVGESVSEAEAGEKLTNDGDAPLELRAVRVAAPAPAVEVAVNRESIAATPVDEEISAPDRTARQQQREAFVSPPAAGLEMSERPVRRELDANSPEPALADMTAESVLVEDTVLRSRQLAMEIEEQKVSVAEKDTGQAPQSFAKRSSAVAGLPYPQQFLADLAGKWDGRAITTPVGPTDYDLDFTVTEANCLSGTADNGLSKHTWRFCGINDSLLLDFHSDFEGNETPIHFRMTGRDRATAVFHADSHDFMELLITLSMDEARIMVIHHGRLHVEIELARQE